MSHDYLLSMCGAAVYPISVPKLADLYLQTKSWDAVRRGIIDDNLLMLNSKLSRSRIAQELIKRLKRLTENESAFLVEATGDDRYALEWVAICRTYPFVEALSKELIAKRYAKMIPDLTYNAYDAFFDDEAEIHPELTKLSKSSWAKMRSSIFRMLRECRLLNEDNVITPLYPSPRCIGVIREARPDDLAIFPKVGALL